MNAPTAAAESPTIAPPDGAAGEGLAGRTGAPPVAPFLVEVFFDGDCPLCRREIDLLRWMDRRERVRFTDIAAAGFDASVYGKSMGELMAEIHGRDASGGWLIGVEVFRRIYAAIGFGPLVWLTRAPGVRHGLDLGYRFFAKRRLWLTGRCDGGACAVPLGKEPGRG